jgi:hypothetical protein
MFEIKFLKIALIITFLASFFFSCKDSTNALKGSDFAVENTNDIQRIHIFKRNGVQAKFERQGDDWIINDRDLANADPMETLLKTLKTMRVSYIPLKAAEPGIIKEMGSKGIKVELYNRKNEKIKCFYVGGGDLAGESTYLIMENSNQPYAVSIPTLIGLIRTHFDYQPLRWRSRYIYPFPKEELVEMEMAYPAEPLQSFRLKKNSNGQFSISAINNLEEKPANISLANAYIKAIKDIRCEAIVNDLEEKDELTSNNPFATLKVKNAKGETKTLSFHKIEDEIGTQGLEADPLKGNKIFRLYIKTSWGDYFLAQYPVIQDIFRPLNYFITK